MDTTGLSIITIIGFIMAVTGAVGVITYVARYRRTRDQMQRGQSGENDSDTPINTFASIWMLNGFLHIGMLLLTLGGIGLIYYGNR